jgi:phospholipase/lecithinase/hemolysin
VGGAQTGTTPLHPAARGDLPSQLLAYNAAVTTPQPHALYTLWIGANDLSAILDTPGLTKTQIKADVTAAIGNVSTFVEGLAADGAKNLLLLTVPDLGVTPDVTRLGPAAEQAASNLSRAFDTALLGAVGTIAGADGIRLFTVDTFALLDSAVAHPSAYGFSNVTAPCWTGNYTSATSGTLCASTLAGQDQYLFWDGEHPTAAAHAIIADAALAAVPEPGGLAVLAVALAALVPLRRRRAG